MRNLTPRFTMRRDGKLPGGDWFTFKKDGDKPKVYIYDEIGFWGTSASDFVSQLNELDANAFDLHLNSPGGEVFDGLAIYEAIRNHKADVTVYVDGLAASAASFIAQAGNTIVMSRFGQMMIHDGIAFAYGNEQDMLDTAQLLSTISDGIADIYQVSAKSRGLSDNDQGYFRDLMRAETWMTGAEAVSFGLADEVTQTEDEDDAEEAKNKWDLGSVYNFAGREKAEAPSRILEKARLTNRQKDTTVTGTASKTKATTDPAVTPAPTPEGDTPSEENENNNTPETATEQVEETVQETATQQTQTPSNSVQGVMIDGKLVTDYATINAHFNRLNTAHVENVQSHRRSVIENLAHAKKISASQIDQLVKMVNGDGNVPAMSDEQFAAFEASYESAPVSSMFEDYTPSGSTVQPANSQSGGTDTDQRIKDLEGILAMHERTMTPEQVKNTNSYKELQALRGSDKS